MTQHTRPAVGGASEAIVIEDPAEDRTGAQLGESAGEIGDAAGQQAGQMMETVSQRGRDQANQQMDRAADGLEQVAGSVRRLGDEMSEEQPQIAGIANTAAEQAERLSHYLRETDPGQLYQQAESFARRQPALVVGGAFLAGILAARFLKASGSQGRRGTGQRGYRSHYIASPEYGQIRGGHRESPTGR
jgi:hypothetical protein